MITTSQLLSAARLRAAKIAPYFRTAIWHLIAKPVDGLGSMLVTEHAVLLYDPAVVHKWGVEQTAIGYLHEVSHILRDHIGRARRLGVTSPTTWNIAADAELNDDLRLMLQPHHLELLPTDVVPEMFGEPAGLTAEAYYFTLVSKPRPPNLTPGRTGQGCGSGAGNPHPAEAEHASPGKGHSPITVNNLRKETAKAIKSQQKRGAGTIPGGWSVWADQALTPPVVRWQDKLGRLGRGTVSRVAGAYDFSYSRPSRRQAGIGYGLGKPLFPAMHASHPTILFIQDTSGSMDAGRVQRGVSEAAAILQSTGAQVVFAGCDTIVHGELTTVHSVQELISKVVGGGGTDFRPIFDAVSRMTPRPDLIVVATDGDGPAPAQNPFPNIPTIWLLIDTDVKPYNQDGPIDWGEFIVVNNDDSESGRAHFR